MVREGPGPAAPAGKVTEEAEKATDVMKDGNNVEPDENRNDDDTVGLVIRSGHRQCQLLLTYLKATGSSPVHTDPDCTCSTRRRELVSDRLRLSRMDEGRTLGNRATERCDN